MVVGSAVWWSLANRLAGISDCGVPLRTPPRPGSEPGAGRAQDWGTGFGRESRLLSACHQVRGGYFFNDFGEMTLLEFVYFCGNAVRRFAPRT